MDQIATTILSQLGGNRFLAMTGAKPTMYGERKLSFRLPRAKKSINHLTVTLRADDTYDMRFGTLIGSRPYAEKDRFEGVYADDLQRLFTEATGLYTSL